MPTSLRWNHLSDHPLVQWGITRGASQEASLPKGAIKKNTVDFEISLILGPKNRFSGVEAPVVRICLTTIVTVEVDDDSPLYIENA